MISIIRLPWPPAALRSNARVHWAEKARATKAAREAGWALAREAKLPKWPNARLVFWYLPPDLRARDVQNMPAALKAYIDGIADAMGCDDGQFRCEFPSQFEGVEKDGCVMVEISE